MHRERRDSRRHLDHAARTQEQLHAEIGEVSIVFNSLLHGDATGSRLFTVSATYFCSFAQA